MCRPKKTERLQPQPQIQAPAQGHHSPHLERADLGATLCQETHDILGNQAVGRMVQGESVDAFEVLIGAELGSAIAGAETEGFSGSNQMMLAKMHNARAAKHGTGTASADVLRMVASSRGSQMPDGIAERMSTALGHDFSHVRIHTDADAAKAAQGIGAKAFAQGSDIYFDTGNYQPGSASGDQLLAHELAHVVQHDEGRVPTGRGAAVSKPTDALEREADVLAERAISGREVDAADQILEIPTQASVSTDDPLLRMADDSAEEAEEEVDEERTTFDTQCFMVERFVSTYGGCFDAAFDPGTGVLDITLRLSFEFSLCDENSQEICQTSPITPWSDQDKALYIEQFQSQAEQGWSGKFSIACTREGWTDVVATPALTMEIVAPTANPHFAVKVYRVFETDGDLNRPWVQGSDTPGETGDSVFGTEHVEDTDKGWNADPVDAPGMGEELKGERVEYVGQTNGRAVIALGQEAVFCRVAELLGAVGQPEHAPTVGVLGWSDRVPEETAYAALCQSDAADRLRAAGVTNPINVSAGGSSPEDFVSFNLHTSQVTTNHEVGHMLGLPDEYRDAEPTVWESIAHFFEVSGVDPVQDVFDEHEVWVHSEGLEDVVRGGSTDSMMNLGNRIAPPHYIPFKEALAEMTAAFIDKDQWRIS